jgi:hypothetical protein
MIFFFDKELFIYRRNAFYYRRIDFLLFSPTFETNILNYAMPLQP